MILVRLTELINNFSNKKSEQTGRLLFTYFTDVSFVTSMAAIADVVLLVGFIETTSSTM